MKIFSQMAETLSRGTSLCCVSELFRLRKSLWISVRGDGDKESHSFPSQIFFLTVAENSVGEPFSVSLISGTEKFFASEGCHNFLSKLLCLTVLKSFKEEPFCAVFQIFSSREKLYG